MKNILIFLVLMVISTVSLADASCGANGEFNPQEQRCVPNQNRGQSAPAYVDNRPLYAAMAADLVTGSGGGYASSFDGYSDAKKIALNRCGSNGRKIENCTVLVTFKNTCGTIAVLPEKLKGLTLWTSGVSNNKNESAQKALDTCDIKATKAGVTRKEPCVIWMQPFCAE